MKLRFGYYLRSTCLGLMTSPERPGSASDEQTSRNADVFVMAKFLARTLAQRVEA